MYKGKLLKNAKRMLALTLSSVILATVAPGNFGGGFRKYRLLNREMRQLWGWELVH